MDVEPGPCVWTRRHLKEWNGRVYDQRERYFLLRARGTEVGTAGRTEEEKRELMEHRWWSAGEIEGAAEEFAPRRLEALLRRLLEEGVPAAPMDASDGPPRLQT